MPLDVTFGVSNMKLRMRSTVCSNMKLGMRSTVCAQKLKPGLLGNWGHPPTPPPRVQWESSLLRGQELPDTRDVSYLTYSKWTLKPRVEILYT